MQPHQIIEFRPQPLNDKLLHVVYEIFASTGESYFPTLVNQLCNTCEVAFALVSVYERNDRTRMRTFVISNHGKLLENFSYTIEDTPCAVTLNHHFFQVTQGIQKRFPRDRYLQDLSIISYQGISIGTDPADPIGLIALMHTQRIKRPNETKQLLEIVAERTAIELQRELTLAQNRQRQQAALFASQSDSVILTDMQGNVTHWNDGARRMYGWTEDEVIGRPYSELAPRAIRDVYGGNSQRSLTDLRWNGELEERCKDGSLLWVKTQLRGLTDSKGRPSGIVRVAKDITEQKLLENRLQSVEHMESMGRLAGGIAHDFNNMLAVIRNCSELLIQQTPADSPMLDSLQTIQTVGERAAVLTSQLLAFSRGQHLNPKVIDVNHTITKLHALLKRLVPLRVSLNFELSSNLTSICVDPNQIEQVIINLVINASDAMPDGGQLTIATHRAQFDRMHVGNRGPITEGEYVVITVSDTGHGMSDEVKAKIFEPFFTTKSTPRGTGLGLSVVHGIVNQSGGHIDVQSMVDGGTTFEIFLPATEQIHQQQPEI